MNDFYITPDDYLSAEKNGVRGPLLEVRIRSLGWDKERAMSEHPQKKKGRIPSNYIQLEEQNGIQYNTLRYRVHQLGWDYERAATQPQISKRAGCTCREERDFA